MNLDADPPAGLSPFLTYEPFYGLTEKPFSLASDPAFFYKGAAHRAAFDALDAGIRRREGLIVLSGEIGTGKTMLCRAVLAQLDRKTFSTFVPDPFVTREDLLKMLLIGFGVASVADVNGGRLRGASRQDLSYPLYEFLDSLVPLQAFAVLVVDEAQNLSLGVIEEIRILAELEKRQKLLQVVLVGQPELRDNLRLPQMRQVEQRVTVRCELAPLPFPDVVEYVNHRLAVATAQPGNLAFTGAALEAVFLASGGVPRLINRVCDRALQRGCEARLKTIDRDTVTAAARDLDLGERHAAVDLRPAADMPRLPFDGESAAAALETLATHSFEPEPGVAEPAPAQANPLAEFDSEPDGPAEIHDASLAAVRPPSRGMFWTLARAFGLGTAALGIAVGAGVLDARTAVDLIAPDSPPGPPVSPERTAAHAATALPVADVLTAALADRRAHEPDTYILLIDTFTDRNAADRAVADLTAGGYRAHWAEVRSDDDSQQQVFVNGYGTLESALGEVTRLRLRPATPGARLVLPPGAGRRVDSTAARGR